LRNFEKKEASLHILIFLLYQKNLTPGRKTDDVYIQSTITLKAYIISGWVGLDTEAVVKVIN
jgi:hypothetical protein